MKNFLPGFTIVAACTAAHAAPSSVTVFGILDVGVSRYSVSNSSSKTAMSSGNTAGSRLGFRGTEDLGGGFSASFHLEGALTPDDGTSGGYSFGRRSTVSLAGPFGEVRLGRDYTTTYWNDVLFDPFGPGNVGTSMILSSRITTTAAPFAARMAANNPAALRTSNSIGYFLPKNLGGFYGEMKYSFHERDHLDDSIVPQSSQGRHVGFRFGYANKALDVVLAYAKATGANPATSAAPDVKTTSLAASYDFDVVKLMAEYSRDRVETASFPSTYKGFLVGLTAPIGAGEIRAAYSRVTLDAEPLPSQPRSSKIALGYLHNLSKRTALYFIAARMSNANGAMMSVGGLPGVANRSSGGYDVGIRHSF